MFLASNRFDHPFARTPYADGVARGFATELAGRQLPDDNPDQVSRAEEVMRAWQVQEAKARFSEFLEASLNEGPQLVTRRGVATAVLVPIDEWRRLQKGAHRSLKELLLADEARSDDLVPPRGQRRHRTAPVFE